jgi:hypothetical protein
VFEALFHTDNQVRDKFLSRMFGIFNEEVVRIWCRDANSPYIDLGRPTLVRTDGVGRGSTLDFTLQNQDGLDFVAELKCELEYDEYRYLVLRRPDQLEHHCKKTAFGRFLHMANPEKRNRYQVTVNGDMLQIAGAILIWGSVTEEGHDEVMQQYRFADILSVEDMVWDLLMWNNQEYHQFLRDRNNWCQSLFYGLSSIISNE